jgi:hypothetical protein
MTKPPARPDPRTPAEPDAGAEGAPNGAGPEGERLARGVPPGLTADEAARYIAQLTGELAAIARHTKLDLLAYFLDMARMEAVTRGRKGRDEQDAA